MIEQIIDTKTEAELSIFWQEISQHLPKTLEREALGDHKIFNAFAIAYKKMKPILLSSYNKQLLDGVEGEMLSKPVSVCTACESWYTYHHRQEEIKATLNKYRV